MRMNQEQIESLIGLSLLQAAGSPLAQFVASSLNAWPRLVGYVSVLSFSSCRVHHLTASTSGCLSVTFRTVSMLPHQEQSRKSLRFGPALRFS